MTTKKETKGAEQTAAKAGQGAEKRDILKNLPKPCVYCGPSVRGVARQYTVYTAEVPEPLKEFIRKHPAARGLLVATERFARTRKALETAGTAEAILYQKVKSEI